MFAVIKANGKQYRVAAADKITIDHLDAEVGAIFTFPVLMLSGETTAIGTPHVNGATVTGEVVEQTRGDKVIAFKKRRRQNSRRKRGFRAELTVVRITEISGLGETARADDVIQATSTEGAPAPEAAADA